MPGDAAVAVVWCDVGGVLISSPDEAARGLADTVGVPWGELWTAIEAAAAEVGEHGARPVELGLLTQRAWAARVTAHLDRPPRVDLGRWDELWYRHRRPVPAMLRALAAARGAGVRVGLLTNSVREWEPHRARLLGDAAFDAVVRSHEVGAAKPDPEIYAAAESALPASPRRTLLIDDTEENCRAARARGWQTIHHRDLHTTIAALAQARSRGR